MKIKTTAAAVLFLAAGIFSAVFAGDLAGKKALMLIAADKFQDDEFAQPKAVLEKNGVKVTVASTTLSEVTGMDGATAKPDMLLKDAKAANYDAVIFVGGSGAVQYLDDPVAYRLAQETVAQGKLLGAICIAPVILTNANVLKGRKATVYPSEAQKLKDGGVDYTGNPVEKDGKSITADGPKSAREFGEALSAALAAS